MDSVNLLGWVGSICFALSAAPQAWKCHKQGHGHGLSHGTLGLWVVGEVATLWYVLISIGLNWPLVTNYGLNLVFLFVILRYRYWPTKQIGRVVRFEKKREQ